MSHERIICTADGSHTLESSIEGECYHSTNGALQESQHVFIDSGLKFVSGSQLNILEVGFGTGLNALLTLLEGKKMNCNIYYETVEQFPIGIDTADRLNYCDMLNIEKEQYFKPFHTAGWNEVISITDSFALKKIQTDLRLYQPSRSDFNLVYFDAFAPDVQPELWSANIFSTLYKHMCNGGILVTYSSKGTVKQNLREAGFNVKRLAGANGKRHMLRAEKPTIGQYNQQTPLCGIS